MERSAKRLILIGMIATLAATASASAATPTKKSWATAANEACRIANAEIRRLPRITSHTSLGLLIADLRASERGFASREAKLAAIPRPSSERTAIASLLRTGQTALRLGEQLIPAAERGDQAAFSRLQTMLDKLNTQYNRLAIALGARVCAENPEPSG